MEILNNLSNLLPKLRTKIQLTGLIVIVGAFVCVRLIAPDQIAAQISAGSIGVLFIVFGQIFQFLHMIPERQRVGFILSMFILFIVFAISLITITASRILEGSHNSNKKLNISHLQLLDEELIDFTGKFPVIKGLKPRPTTQYQYSKPSDLVMSIIFMVDGYHASQNGKTDLDGKITIQNDDGRYLASTSIIHVSDINSWKQRPLVQKIGIEEILSFTGLPSKSSINTPIPYFMILDSFEPDQIPERLGKVIISVSDGLSNQTVNENLNFHVDHKINKTSQPTN